MTVTERLRAVLILQHEIRQTPCADCDHPYVMHVPGLHCYALRCRCPKFADPAPIPFQRSDIGKTGGEP